MSYIYNKIIKNIENIKLILININYQEILYHITINSIILYVCYVIYNLIKKNNINISYDEIIYVEYVYYLLIIVITLIVLSIIYLLIKQNIEKVKGIKKIIINNLFYYPNIISEIIKYIIDDYNNTPPIILVLLIIEIILIMMYIYIPKIIEKIYINKKNIILYKEFLNKETIIYENNFRKLQKYNLEKYKINYINNNYSISFWIYINQPDITNLIIEKNLINNDNNLNTNIFSFISNYNNTNNLIGRPSLKYSIDEDNKILYKVYYSDNDNIKNSSDNYDYIELTNQKWNNIVFNYSMNNVDLFVNGDLEKSFNFKDNLPNLISKDSRMVIGSNNGLKGGICNLEFTDNPLTYKHIKNKYNLLKNKNPPI